MQFSFNFKLAANDDNSSQALHYQLVQQALDGGADVIFNGNPSFAVNESQQVRRMKSVGYLCPSNWFHAPVEVMDTGPGSNQVWSECVLLLLLFYACQLLRLTMIIHSNRACN